jgi:hypothetical protein
MRLFLMTFIIFSACASQVSFAADNTTAGSVDCTKVEQAATLKKVSAESMATGGDQAKVLTVKSAQ